MDKNRFSVRCLNKYLEFGKHGNSNVEIPAAYSEFRPFYQLSATSNINLANKDIEERNGFHYHDLVVYAADNSYQWKSPAFSGF